MQATPALHPTPRAVNPVGASYIAMALIWWIWVAACRAIRFSRALPPAQSAIRRVDVTEPAPFVDTEATWWSV